MSKASNRFAWFKVKLLTSEARRCFWCGCRIDNIWRIYSKYHRHLPVESLIERIAKSSQIWNNLYEEFEHFLDNYNEQIKKIRETHATFLKKNLIKQKNYPKKIAKELQNLGDVHLVKNVSTLYGLKFLQYSSTIDLIKKICQEVCYTTPDMADINVIFDTQYDAIMTKIILQINDDQAYLNTLPPIQKIEKKRAAKKRNYARMMRSKKWNKKKRMKKNTEQKNEYPA